MLDLYADMFDLAPVSLWLEDYSALKPIFEGWRAAGVTDLRRHLQQHPELVPECVRGLQLLRVNRRTLELFGARDLQHLRDNLHLVLREEMHGAFIEEMGQLWDGACQLSTQTVNYTLSGRRLNMLFKASVLPGHEARWDRVLVSLEDVSERQRAADYAQSLFDHSPVSLWVLDLSGVQAIVAVQRAIHGPLADPQRVFTDEALLDRCLAAVRVIDVNHPTVTMFAAPDKPTLLHRLGDVFGSDLRAGMRALVAMAWHGEQFLQRELSARRLDGRELHAYSQLSVLPGHAEQWGRVLMSLTDITARRQAEAELAYVSSHDALTGLHNRSFFNAEVQRLEQSPGGGPVSVLVIDLDGLKLANDTLGHAVGDELLRRAGRLIAALVRPPASASRTGGDEFALLLPGHGPAEVAEVLRGLREAEAEGNRHHAGPALAFSVGTATAASGEGLAGLLQRADALMYEDKRRRYAGRSVDRRG